ncbi:type II toxin-antitoxin system death-on-curing family toxin [Stenotrophomonas maltophilia]|uniref:type II toxin-antitoxin system death-on-curing family toxin n=1 Tax=Stenotrophomonas maltophilia TaxID=40324 RepID=UPI0012B087E0|nr:Fic family protein [Stenotrophomonas maltophilia]MCU1206472.1 Fic family protein [Stenotrophomonas maltophilia]QGL94541.1 type II toxin-antitoxin system death-on-curing family toxin [Stenotrophomonas maltophilia]
MWIPSKQDVIEVHAHLERLFEREDDPISPSGVKSQSLLESACTRPHTGMGDHEKYPSTELKLAALFHSLTKNHPFHNGNKRTALATLLTALSRNGKRLDSSINDDAIYKFVLAVTADEFPTPEHGKDVDQVVHEISHWIKSHTGSLPAKASSMRVAEFVDRCAEAGARTKLANGATIISNGTANIRISKSTRRIDGAVVRSYLRTLRLNESHTGASIDEFQEGVSADRREIYRYLKAMRRLAKT